MKTYRPKQGEPLKINWKKTDFYSGCCDCGLVHKQDFSVKGDILIIKTWREDKLTLQKRKKYGINIRF